MKVGERKEGGGGKHSLNISLVRCGLRPPHAEVACPAWGFGMLNDDVEALWVAVVPRMLVVWGWAALC